MVRIGSGSASLFIWRWPAKPDGGYWLEGVTRKVRMTIGGKHVTLTMENGKCHNEGNVNRHPKANVKDLYPW